jgi:NAD(P)-dependent dehydrogenase (short-subunit alcohol dehydrogenase family)
MARFVAEGDHVIGLDKRESDGLPSDQFLQIDLQRLVQDGAYRADAAKLIAELTGGRLDVLVNNAAVQVVSPSQEMSQSDWCRVMDVNLHAPFLLAQAVLPLLEATRGCIINIASIHAGLTKPGFVAYAASKAGLVGLTRAMAVDLGGRVRVNAIAPAAIATPMLVDGFSGRPEALQQLEAFHPTGAIGQPEEVARLACMIASSELPFLNGAVIAVDGGIGSRLHDPA